MALSAGVVSGGARGMMCGIYQGIEYYGYDITEDGVNRLNNDIDTVTEKNQKDGIVCIFLAHNLLSQYLTDLQIQRSSPSARI